MLDIYLNTFKSVIKSLVVTDSKGTEIKLEEAVRLLKTKFEKLKTTERTIYLVGNGGSNGIVSHASVDLLNTCKIKAVPLTDASNITCFANDYGYENVFSSQLSTFLSQDDLLVAVSSSGNSKNIINCVNVAKEKNTYAVSFTGFSPSNILRSSSNLNFWIDSNDYGMVEIGHAFLLHYLTDSFKNGLVNTLNN